MKIRIEESAAEGVPPGSYEATFVEMSEIDTSKGEAYRWVFKTDAGKTISGLTDRSAATTKNKLGRWLAGISGAPLVGNTEVDPLSYIGNRYMLAVDPDSKGKGGGKLTTFSKKN